MLRLYFAETVSVQCFQFVAVVSLLLVTWTELNDPIDLGYYPAHGFSLFYLRIAIIFVQSVLCMRFFKTPQKLKQILIVGGIINFALFAVSEMIAAAVGFS